MGTRKPSPATKRKVNTAGTAEYEAKTERLEHKAGNVRSDNRSERLYGRVKKRDIAAGNKYSSGVEVDYTSPANQRMQAFTDTVNYGTRNKSGLKQTTTESDSASSVKKAENKSSNSKSNVKVRYVDYIDKDGKEKTRAETYVWGGGQTTSGSATPQKATTTKSDSASSVKKAESTSSKSKSKDGRFVDYIDNKGKEKTRWEPYSWGSGSSGGK